MSSVDISYLGAAKVYLAKADPVIEEVNMATVEERLARVERELERFKRDNNAKKSKLGWLEKVRGTFKGDPDFDEIVRLGKELRDQETTEAKE